MKTLVTGATGYIGHQLALTLANQGYETNLLVRNPNSINIPKHKNIKVFTGDITTIQTIDKAIKGCNQVYHTAAIVKLFDKDLSLFYKINVEGTHHLLQKSLEYGVEKFLFTSSCSVIGASDGKAMTENDIRLTPYKFLYDKTKFEAEELVKTYSNKGLFTVIVSPSKVYGHSFCQETKPISMNKVIHRFVNGGTTFIPKPKSLLSNYCYIEDIIQGHLLAMKNGQSGEKYILGGENASYTDFFCILRNLTQTHAKLIEIPKVILRIVAQTQWILYKTTGKDPLITNEGVNQICCNKIFSSEKAIRELGYQITPLKEGLQQTIHLLNQHYEK